MKPKPLSFVFTIMAVLILQASAYAQECDLTRTGLNLCDGGQTAYVTNTSNTITIHDPGRFPVSGTYDVTLYYYKQSANACQGPFTCSGASVNSSGSAVTISLGSCINLPANFSTEGIIRINFTNGPGGASYFFHIYGGACMLPLPVVLSAFNVQKTTIGGVDVVRVTWTTDQETNFDRFVIERGSTGGNLDFDFDIGAVAGTNTSVPHNYEFIDYYPQDGTNYYRLRIIDTDGKFTHSNFKGAYCDGCNSQPPQVDCGSIGINGPSQLCEQETYSVSQGLFYNKYTWSVTNLNAYYSGFPNAPSKPSILLMAAGDGPDYVNVSMSRCTPATRNKYKAINVGQALEAYIHNYWVGNTPEPLIQEANGVNYVSEGQIIVDVYSPWGVPSNMNFLAGDALNWQWQPSSQRLSLYMNFGNYIVFRLDLETVCGPRNYTFAISCTEMLNYYSLSPNPASSQLNVYVDDRKLDKMKLKRSLNQNIQQVIITDKSGNTILQQKYPVNTRNISVNIAALKTDIYTIRIFDGKKWTAMKFIKQ